MNTWFRFMFGCRWKIALANPCFHPGGAGREIAQFPKLYHFSQRCVWTIVWEKHQWNIFWWNGAAVMWTVSCFDHCSLFTFLFPPLTVLMFCGSLGHLICWAHAMHNWCCGDIPGSDILGDFPLVMSFTGHCSLLHCCKLWTSHCVHIQSNVYICMYIDTFSKYLCGV